MSKKSHTANQLQKVDDDIKIYESIGSLCGATGYSEKHIKAVKRDGCDAFRSGNRIALGPLLRWINTHSPKKGEAIYEVEHALRERADRIITEVKADEAVKNSIPTQSAEEIFNAAMLPVRQQFLAIPSLGPSVNPSDPEHAKAHLVLFRDESLKLCREFKLQKDQE